MKIIQRKKNSEWKWQRGNMILAMLLFIGSSLFVSCKDEFYYDEKEPEWLGASIYDYLKSEEGYNTYIRLIDDVEYEEVLSKTGSKTLFVADDAAFERFYLNNSWGVTSYEGLSQAQKKTLLNYGMIDNAYLIETLANYFNGSLQNGTALRRSTSVSILDTISLEDGGNLPTNQYWDNYRTSGLYLLKDDSPSPIVHFLPKSLFNAGITNEDFKTITGLDRSADDAFIFNNKVIQRDITCKNGYVHVLENVLVPPSNMAEHIRTNGHTNIFSELLERFSVPHYNPDITQNYKRLHSEFSDSIFTKRYFASYGNSSESSEYPDGTSVNSNLMLPFDPGWNGYVPLGPGKNLQSDMGAMLVPTDQAMTEYFDLGSGKILKERYGSWENIPDEIIALLLRRHMRESFVESIPSKFSKMNDSENSPINITPSDVESSFLGVNGVVYHTNSVYPPDDYVSIYGPVLFSEKTQVFNWAIRQNDFRLYLNSLVSQYSFFVPTDEFFKGYIDPIAYTKNPAGALKYWYNTETGTVNATIYKFYPETNFVDYNDSIGVITSSSFLSNRLLDLLDSHIVIGDVESGAQFYFTKGGNALKVEGAGTGLTIQAGGDIELDNTVHVENIFDQANGRTYFIDKPLQTPLKSVYKVLSETPQFSKFFELLSGFPSTSKSVVFVKKNNYYGIDFNIKFFNTFNYTIYVPTNEAMQTAIDEGLIHTWDEINLIEDVDLQEQYIVQLERFLRYHFQDNSVFIGGEAYTTQYQTATIKENNDETQFRTYKDKYYKLGIECDGTDLYLSTEKYGTAKVIKDDGLYNILVRDYVFSNTPGAYKEIDGTGVGIPFTSSSITTSSTAVIHQIDNVLKFE